MRDAGGNGANTKLAACKLDQMGFYKSHSGLTNSEDVMARRKNQFMLASRLVKLRSLVSTQRRRRSWQQSPAFWRWHRLQIQSLRQRTTMLPSSLRKKSDTAYLVMPESRSVYAGHFYLSDWPRNKPNLLSTKRNGPILTTCKTIHNFFLFRC